MPKSRSVRFDSLLAAAFVAIAVAAPATSQDKPKVAPKHLVRFSFKEGAVRHSVIELDTVTKMSRGAIHSDSRLKTTVWMTTRLKATKGNTAQIELTLTRIKAFAEDLSGKVNYDSNNVDSDPGPFAPLADLLKGKIRFKMTDLGQVSELVLPDIADHPSFNKASVQQVLMQGLSRLPSQPLAIGDKWQTKEKATRTLLNQREMVIHTSNELLAADKQSITVKQTETIDPETDGLPGGMKPKDISIAATYKLDLRTGLPIEATILLTAKQTGPIKMDISAKQTLKPAPPKKSKATAGKPGK